MSARHSLHNKNTVKNYKALNSKGFTEGVSENSSQEDSDQLEIEVNPDGERELCGSNSNTDQSMEEGELSPSKEDSDFDEETQECVVQGNLSKLKQLLKKQEEENKKTATRPRQRAGKREEE